MKRVILLLCLLSGLGAAGKESGGGAGAKVDPRVELLGIVFRLAGAPEYSSTYAKQYVEDIEAWFAPYREDTLVRYVKRIRSQYYVGYDAVARLAVHLEGRGGQYRLPEEVHASLVSYGQWSVDGALEFVGLLNEFYKKSHFDRFFKRHRAWYGKMEERFDRQVGFDRGWYTSFYGEEGESDYRIVIGCGNGSANYGISVVRDGGEKTAYSIMGCRVFDREGLADFSGGRPASILIHEFNHSFVNPLMFLDGNRERLEAAGETIIAVLKDELSAQGYPYWEPMFNEAVVRAAVVRYMRDMEFSAQEIENEIRTQRNQYFLWTASLDSLLGEYSRQRDRYPTLRSFYPRIIEFFDRVAENIEEMKAQHLSHCPQVAALSPFENGAQGVDPGLTEMVVAFDLPLSEDLFAVVPDEQGGEFPAAQVMGFVGDDRKAVRIGLRLEPGKQYGMRLETPRLKTSTEQGYMLQPYSVQFSTAAH